MNVWLLEQSAINEWLTQGTKCNKWMSDSRNCGRAKNSHSNIIPTDKLFSFRKYHCCLCKICGLSQVNSCTVLYSTVLYNTVLYSTIQYSTVVKLTGSLAEVEELVVWPPWRGLSYHRLPGGRDYLLYSNVLYCNVQYSTVLYCTVMYSTVLYCTLQHCTIQYDSVL